MRCGCRCDVAIVITGPSATGAGIILVNVSVTDSGLGIINGQDAALALSRLAREGYKLECCEPLSTGAFVQYTFVNCWNKEEKWDKEEC